MGIVLKILLNTNGVKTLKVHDLGAVNKILTYVAPVSLNPDFHRFFTPKIRLTGEYIQYAFCIPSTHKSSEASNFDPPLSFRAKSTSVPKKVLYR